MHAKMNQKMDFMSSNDQILIDKLQKQVGENDENIKDRISFFPFTHGEAIEAQRREMAEIHKKEHQEEHAKRAKKEYEKQREREDQAAFNKMKQEIRLKQLRDEDEYL